VRRVSDACPGARPVWLGTRTPPPSLTRREQEIARLAAEGLPSRLIADRLAVSVRTVDSHLYRVYMKLGVRDRAGLAAALSR
jgi:DNA-binding CsgD family transcriptional regulator